MRSLELRRLRITLMRLYSMQLTNNFSKSEFDSKDSEIFFNAVLNPKAPNNELSKAANEFKVIFY